MSNARQARFYGRDFASVEIFSEFSIRSAIGSQRPSIKARRTVSGSATGTLSLPKLTRRFSTSTAISWFGFLEIHAEIFSRFSRVADTQAMPSVV